MPGKGKQAIGNKVRHRLFSLNLIADYSPRNGINQVLHFHPGVFQLCFQMDTVIWVNTQTTWNTAQCPVRAFRTVPVPLRLRLSPGHIHNILNMGPCFLPVNHLAAHLVNPPGNRIHIIAHSKL